MGWSEEVRVYQRIGSFCVFSVRFDGMFSPTHVVIGMISNPMPFIYDTLVQLRMAFYILAHHKKSGTSPKLS